MTTILDVGELLRSVGPSAESAVVSHTTKFKDKLRRCVALAELAAAATASENVAPPNTSTTQSSTPQKAAAAAAHAQLAALAQTFGVEHARHICRSLSALLASFTGQSEVQQAMCALLQLIQELFFALGRRTSGGGAEQNANKSQPAKPQLSQSAPDAVYTHFLDAGLCALVQQMFASFVSALQQLSHAVASAQRAAASSAGGAGPKPETLRTARTYNAVFVDVMLVVQDLSKYQPGKVRQFHEFLLLQTFSHVCSRSRPSCRSAFCAIFFSSPHTFWAKNSAWFSVHMHMSYVYWSAVCTHFLGSLLTYFNFSICSRNSGSRCCSC